MNLSKQNLDIATQYFLGNTTLLDQKDDDFRNLFLSYASDNNSSTVREAVTLHCLGYTSYKEKHGADGVNPSTGKEVEVKPKFIAEGKTLGTAVGNFNDLTLDLLEKKKDYSVICSLFSENRLIYIVEFPISLIYEKMRLHILKKMQGPGNSRTVCSFNYNDYDNDLLHVHYYDDEAARTTKVLSKPHRSMLNKRYVS